MMRNSLIQIIFHVVINANIADYESFGVFCCCQDWCCCLKVGPTLEDRYKHIQAHINFANYHYYHH